MTPRRIKLTLALTLIALFAGIVAASAASPLSGQFRLARFFARHGGKQLPDKIKQRVMNDLGLTEAQRAAVDGVLDAHQPQIDELREAMMSDGFRMMAMGPADDDYDQVVEDVSRSSGEQVTAMIRLVSRIRVEVHEVLTLEQRARAGEIKAEVQRDLIELMLALENG